jgi:hypothetical protein
MVIYLFSIEIEISAIVLVLVQNFELFFCDLLASGGLVNKKRM